MPNAQTVIVLDDEAVVGQSLKRLLASEGCQVKSYVSPADALVAIKYAAPDLLITDVRLPGMSGIEVLAQAKKLRPDMEVIVLTGYPNIDDKQQAQGLGAFEYMEKPVRPDVLLTSVKSALARRASAKCMAFIEGFGSSVVCGSAALEGVTQHSSGAWSRPISGGLVELGVDVRGWFLKGQMVEVEFLAETTVKEGEPFVRIVSTSGARIDVPSPISGQVVEVNRAVNEAIAALGKACPSEGWMPWVFKINA